MSSDQQHPGLVSVQDMIKQMTDIPYCTGTVQLNAPYSLLFFRSQGESRFIDFADPTETQLKALAEACSPTSFGRNQEDVIDENYRKAGKMDSADFATQFLLSDSGVLKSVVETLFKAKVGNVKAELYKLNVYGAGSFFKSHVDTPRSDTMFGSLVVVLPTPHTGSSLLFRHHGVEYTFDSANGVSASSIDAQHAAFAAFYSDVEHEVAEVTNGYRVTLTYNLYHIVANPSNGPSGVIMKDGTEAFSTMFKTTLISLLSTPTFLPDGGLLAFGLSYDYLFNSQSTKLSAVGKRLKGIDALLKRVCDELELAVSVKALYCKRYQATEYCFMDTFVKFRNNQIEESLFGYLSVYAKGAIFGYDVLSRSAAPNFCRTKVIGVVWAKQPERIQGELHSLWQRRDYDLCIWEGLPGCTRQACQRKVVKLWMFTGH